MHADYARSGSRQLLEGAALDARFDLPRHHGLFEPNYALVNPAVGRWAGKGVH
jgi:hypothetical protein